MTDEERRELCAELRDPSLHTVLQTCDKAANEIERLAKNLTEAEAALRNTLLHYDINDVHFLTPK